MHNKTFSSARYQAAHYRRVHARIPNKPQTNKIHSNAVCEICGKKCTKTFSLARYQAAHYRRVHARIPNKPQTNKIHSNAVCEICGKKCKHPVVPKITYLPYVQVCNKTFSSACYQAAHYRRVHARIPNKPQTNKIHSNAVCEICGKEMHVPKMSYHNAQQNVLKRALPSGALPPSSRADNEQTSNEQDTFQRRLRDMREEMHPLATKRRTTAEFTREYRTNLKLTRYIPTLFARYVGRNARARYQAAHYRRVHARIPNKPQTNEIHSNAVCEICGKEMHALATKRRTTAEFTREYRINLNRTRYIPTLSARYVARNAPARYQAAHYRRVYARIPNKPQPNKIHSNAVCEICGKKCTSKATLVYHQRTHSGEKPYQCTECPKRFSILQRLQIHIRTHTGERPCQCPHCPKAFKHKAALNRHLRVHTGVKPYQCTHCGKSFSQSNSMKGHVRSVHLKLPALYRRAGKRGDYSE
ncbi:zinc-finger double domain-containing protein [Phthorimaea operculella]|nr:zinc-finger double domain-containing protein [Phthorimaea operculella]